MKNKIVLMGIDVSKEKLDVSLNNRHYQYDNDHHSIVKLIEFANTQFAN